MERVTKITKTQFRDGNISCLDRSYTYFKIYGDKQYLRTLTDINGTRGEPYLFNGDNYCLPTEQPTKHERAVGEFYEKYLALYQKIDVKKLTGIDRLIFPYILYPFRQTEHDIESVQYKYGLNFHDTLIVPAGT